MIRRRPESGAAGATAVLARPGLSPLSLRAAAVRDLLRHHWAVAAVLALYAAAAFVVPTMASAPVGDDWVYTRSVEFLVRRHRLEILDLSVVTLIAQVIWGGLFATVFGMSFGALRLSTLVIVFLSAVALYALCRELGISRQRSALGTAAYLFNPLTFVLSYTFMSDPHFTALLVIATYWYARGLREDRVSHRAIVVGSGFAALAFLVRQQGALIPLAVILYLLAARRLPPNRRGIERFLRVVAIPTAVLLLYYAWLYLVHGVPVQQTSFLRSIRQAGWDESWLLIQRMTFIGAMYLGFFALPVAAAALVGGRRLLRFHSPLGVPLLIGWLIGLIAGLEVFGGDGRRMPYIGQFVSWSGLGPNDLIGGRPHFAGTTAEDWATGVCAAASFVLAFLLCRRFGEPRSPIRGTAGLVVAIGLWQAVGVVPPSFHFRNWIISVDRYLLPLVPFTICLILWAVRDLRLAVPVGWLIVAALGVFSVAGTRDFLVFQEATWDMARAANDQGVGNTRLDAGASWDGYHLWEYSKENGIRQQTRGGPWWTNLFGPATDSTYIVAGAPVGGYDVVRQVQYSSWLQRQPVSLYLLRRQGFAGPP